MADHRRNAARPHPDYRLAAEPGFQVNDPKAVGTGRHYKQVARRVKVAFFLLADKAQETNMLFIAFRQLVVKTLEVAHHRAGNYQGRFKTGPPELLHSLDGMMGSFIISGGSLEKDQRPFNPMF